MKLLMRSISSRCKMRKQKFDSNLLLFLHSLIPFRFVIPSDFGCAHCTLFFHSSDAPFIPFAWKLTAWLFFSALSCIYLYFCECLVHIRFEYALRTNEGSWICFGNTLLPLHGKKRTRKACSGRNI